MTDNAGFETATDRIRKVVGVLLGIFAGVVLYSGFAIYWPGGADALGWFDPFVLGIVAAHVFLAVGLLALAEFVKPTGYAGLIDHVR